MLSDPSQQNAYLLAIEVDNYRLLPMEAQASLIAELRVLVSDTPEYRRPRTQPDPLRPALTAPRCQPFEAGVFVLFFDEIASPIRCAQEMAEALLGQDRLRIRTGIHCGPVYQAESGYAQSELFGESLLIAQRVMECGDAGHILLSRAVVERLAVTSIWSRYWSRYIREIGSYSAADNSSYPLFNLCLPNIGNPNWPRSLDRERAGQVLAHILTLDVVGFSVETASAQTSIYRELNELVRNTAEFRRVRERNRLTCRSVEGGLILAFYDEIASPVQCALEIAEALKRYSRIQARMGLHSGPVDRIEDINEQSNVSGEGLTLARQIVLLGDAGHILLSNAVAAPLNNVTFWRQRLRGLGMCRVSRHQTLELFTLYTKELGIRETPKAIIQYAAQSIEAPTVQIAPAPAAAPAPTLRLPSAIPTSPLYGGPSARASSPSGRWLEISFALAIIVIGIVMGFMLSGRSPEIKPPTLPKGGSLSPNPPQPDPAAPRSDSGLQIPPDPVEEDKKANEQAELLLAAGDRANEAGQEEEAKKNWEKAYTTAHKLKLKEEARNRLRAPMPPPIKDPSPSVPPVDEKKDPEPPEKSATVSQSGYHTFHVPEFKEKAVVTIQLETQGSLASAPQIDHEEFNKGAGVKIQKPDDPMVRVHIWVQYPPASHVIHKDYSVKYLPKFLPDHE